MHVGGQGRRDLYLLLQAPHVKNLELHRDVLFDGRRAVVSFAPSAHAMSKLPRGSVDTHFHVMDTEKYALSPSRHFTPPSITTQDAIDFHTSQGFDRTVVTQALSFGNDLSHLLQYLETRGSDKHRAIVTFEPSISDEELRALHAAGARSVRIDLHYHKAMKDAKKQLHLLKAYGKRLSDCKGLESWSIQLFHLNTHLWDDPELQQAVQNLEVPLVVDHFAGFSAPSRKSALRTDVSRTEALEGSKWSLEQSPGFDSFRRLLKGGKVWVKLSGKSSHVRSLCPAEAYAQSTNHSPV